MLAESDRALAAVKDIFGDDPKVHVTWYVCIHSDSLFMYSIMRVHVAKSIEGLYIAKIKY